MVAFVHAWSQLPSSNEVHAASTDPGGQAVTVHATHAPPAWYVPAGQRYSHPDPTHAAPTGRGAHGSHRTSAASTGQADSCIPAPHAPAATHATHDPGSLALTGNLPRPQAVHSL